MSSKELNKMGDFYSQRGRDKERADYFMGFRYFELSTYTKIKRVDSFHTD